MAIPIYNFKKYTKEEWLELIDRSLKKGSIEDFKWHITEDLEGITFAHEEDHHLGREGVFGTKNDNDWLIGLVFDSLPAFHKVEKEGFMAFRMGVNEETDIPELLAVLKTYPDHDWIIHFESLPVFEHFAGVIEKTPHEGLNVLEKISGGIEIGNVFEGRFEPLYQLLKDRMPGFELCLTIPGSKNADDLLQRVATVFRRLAQWMKKENLQQNDVQFLLRHMRISYELSEAFLFEVAMLRALKIIWNNFTKAYGLRQEAIRINGTIDLEDLTRQSNDQLILGANAALAAVIGGVHGVFFKYTVDSYELPISRLTRNIQLILKHESNLAVVQDPLAGSYAIGSLTERISEIIWKKLAGK